jgi:hypothetical protein
MIVSAFRSCSLTGQVRIDSCGSCVPNISQQHRSVGKCQSLRDRDACMGSGVREVNRAVTLYHRVDAHSGNVPHEPAVAVNIVAVAVNTPAVAVTF